MMTLYHCWWSVYGALRQMICKFAQIVSINNYRKYAQKGQAVKNKQNNINVLYGYLFSCELVYLYGKSFFNYISAKKKA